jgi:hypothetical protein
MCDTTNLTSKLVNMMQPPNSISIGRVNETGNIQKPLVMLQPLPLGPYGFLEKLWPSYTNMNMTNEHEAVRIFEHHLDNDPVSYSSSSATDYTRYTLDDTVFKKRHIQESKQHIIIPSEALRDRSMICLMYEGGMYQKVQTGSYDVLRWFMLLPSSRGPYLYPVEIKIEPTGQVKAGVLTNSVHDQGLWTMEFEDPHIPAKYITTYTEHVVAALERTQTQNHVNDAMLYTATPPFYPDRLRWKYESDNDVMLTTNNVDLSLLDKLRKSLGL